MYRDIYQEFHIFHRILCTSIFRILLSIRTIRSIAILYFDHLPNRTGACSLSNHKRFDWFARPVQSFQYLTGGGIPDISIHPQQKYLPITEGGQPHLPHLRPMWGLKQDERGWRARYDPPPRDTKDHNRTPHPPPPDEKRGRVFVVQPPHTAPATFFMNRSPQRVIRPT